MRQIAVLLTPLYDLMHERVLRSDVLGTDDTPVEMQEKGRGKTRKSYLWGYRGDENHPFNVFDFTTGHSREGPLKFLRRDDDNDSEKMFRGYLQSRCVLGLRHSLRAGRCC